MGFFNRSNECPNRKSVNIVERDEEEKVYCELDGEDVYSEEADEDIEQTYVIRRLMLIPKHEKVTQQHPLFLTRCTIGE